MHEALLGFIQAADALKHVHRASRTGVVASTKPASAAPHGVDVPPAASTDPASAAPHGVDVHPAASTDPASAAPHGVDASRAENSAEHAWHVALIAVLLHAEVTPAPDLGQVLAMIAVHDLVEIEAGDTFAFDDKGLATQAAREQAAAETLFATLPPPQAARVMALWQEFEACETPEARFAMGCDRLQGFAQQVGCGAPAWAAVGLTHARSLKRMQPAIDLGAPFDALIRRLYERALAAGLLKP